MLDSSDGPLQLGVEGDFCQNFAFFGCKDFMYGDISILEPLDEGDFGTIANRDVEGVFSHLNVGLRVVDDALFDLFNDFLVKLAIHESVEARVLDIEFLCVEAVDFHILRGHRASLTHADVRKNSCILNRARVTHKHVIVLAHLEDTVSEGDRDGHRQAFGDRDNEHDKGNHDVVNQLLGKFGSTNHFIDTDLQEDDNHRY